MDKLDFYAKYLLYWNSYCINFMIFSIVIKFNIKNIINLS